MSTIDKLVSGGRLRAVRLGLQDDELPDRGLFGTDRLHEFLANDLAKIAANDAQLSPLEQVAALFGRYLTNVPLVLKSPISPLRHLDDAVWELKTTDVRIFGWFARKDCFVADGGADVSRLKSGALTYNGFIVQTAWTRRNLGFLTSDYVTGTKPDDVLERYTLAPRPQGRSVYRRR
jgi:hypothetical protein